MYENDVGGGVPGSSLGKELIRQANKAFNTVERSNAQFTWALLSEFILPSQNRGWFEDPSVGIRRDRRKFDDTAVQANRDLASAMHSTITNPTMKWMKFRFRDEHLNRDPQASNWLAYGADRVYERLSESNFDLQMSKFYLSYSALGHGILFQDEDFNFSTWHLAETAFAENDRGVVDTIYRKFKLTLKALYDKFGDAIGEELLTRLEKEPLYEMQLYHVVKPNDKDKIKYDIGNVFAKPENRPFICYYVLSKNAVILKKDGYYELPCYVSRWSNLPAETYGFGPGHVSIADIRTLNKIQETKLMAMALAVRPPIITTKQNVVAGDFRPGSMTVVRDIEGFKEFVTQSRFPDVREEVSELQAMIKGNFYIDKLMLPPRTETGEMTAYEVQQRLEQMQQVLGPVLSRLDVELLQPLVLRSFKILIREGVIPPAPAQVIQTSKSKKLDFEILFVNSLARSQQMSELRNVQQFVQEVAQLVQLNPQDPKALDNIDFDKIVQYDAKIRDIPPEILVSQDKVNQIRQQRAQAQQAQMMLSMAQQAGDATNSFAQAGAAGQPQQKQG